jgi:hypothetical protein
LDKREHTALSAVGEPQARVSVHLFLVSAGRMCRRLIWDFRSHKRAETLRKSIEWIEITRVRFEYHLPLQMGTNWIQTETPEITFAAMAASGSRTSD